MGSVAEAGGLAQRIGRAGEPMTRGVVAQRGDRRRECTATIGIRLRDAGESAAAIVSECGRAAREVRDRREPPGGVGEGGVAAKGVGDLRQQVRSCTSS